MKTEQLLYRLYKGQLCIKTLLMNVFIYTYYLNKHFLNIRKAVWYQEKIYKEIYFEPIKGRYF